jgi:hypothetical protein
MVVRGSGTVELMTLRLATRRGHILTEPEHQLGKSGMPNRCSS